MLYLYGLTDFIVGVTKKYQLTYESVEVMHALFDKSVAVNRWKIRTAVLKEYAEFFGPKTEQLDIYAEGGKVTLMSFTEKIVDSKQGKDITCIGVRY